MGGATSSGANYVTNLKLTPESKLDLRLHSDHRVHAKNTCPFASVIAGSVLVGGVFGATVLAKSNLTPANIVLAATSPSPTFKSNEDPMHEKNESAAQETAENNGTFHPGPGGHSGMSNESAAHEARETAAQEAAEKT